MYNTCFRILENQKHFELPELVKLSVYTQKVEKLCNNFSNDSF